MSSKYAFGRTVSLPFDEAVRRAVEALGEQGFGVLSDIDVAATLQKKLGLDVPPYRILGACNPQFAHQALEMEPEIGTLLPCNVVVRAIDGEKTRIDVMDPAAVLGLVDRKDIEPIAQQVRQRLDQVLAAI